MDSKSEDSIEINRSWSQKLLALFQRLLYDIWASPINLILVALILCLLVKLFLLKRKPSNASSQKQQIPVHLPKLAKRDFTIDELRAYNGIESNGRILTAVCGDVFDVSKRNDLYGIGK